MARNRLGRDIDGERIDAQVLTNLFGQDLLPTQIGRYRVVSHLGEGGMGIVYLAYDARLDRKVAIKLLHATSDARTRERAIREAQALAQLVHPNVVRVYDVHTDDADVSIAMEFVAGQTLDVWAVARPRRWRELRAVMLDVAYGVAAAHAVDLVHQDLKPTNVVVDPTGRARVLDFGLARIHAAEMSTPLPSGQGPHSSHGGTPSYMAPEQLASGSVGPPADQFGWSVMFWELLYGELPFADTDAVMAGRRRPPPAGARAPRWLREVVERGLAVEPAARHADMQALIAAVETSPRSRRMRLYSVACIALVLTLWALFAHLGRSAATTSCAASGAVITESWGDTARAGLQTSFVATGAPFAASTLERILPLLDEYAGAWRDARVRVCVAEHVDATLPSEQATSMLVCLGDARDRLGSLLGILTGADPDEIGRDTVRSAIAAVTTLPRISVCEGPTRPRAQPTSLDGHTSAEVARIRGLLIKAAALGATGRAAEGLAHAEWASTTAAALDFPPVLLEAELQRGLLLAALGRYEDADAALKDTFYDSGRIRHDDVHLDAAIALIHETVNQDKLDESGQWGRTARMLLERDDAGSDLRWALLYRKLGLLHLAQGEYPDAIALHRRALAVHQRVYGPHHPTIAEDLSNLADCHRLNGEIGQAIELGARSVELTERALGPDHPGIADGLGNLGVIYGDAGDLPRALETLNRVRELHERTLPANHAVIGVALNNIGATHYRMGSQELALAAVTRARTILERSLGPEHSEVATSHFTAGLVQLVLEQPGTALASLERARSIWERELPPEHPKFGALHMALCDAHAGLRQWDHAFVSCERAVAVYEPFADAELPAYRLALANLGIWLVEAGELTRAQPHLERGIEMVSRHTDDPGLLGELQFALARCLWHDRDQRARADNLVQAALVNLTAGGPDYAGDLVKTRGWLTNHSR